MRQTLARSSHHWSLMQDEYATDQHFGPRPRDDPWAAFTLLARTWHAGRKAEAVTALAAMGIASLVKPPNDFGKNGGE